MFPAPGLICKHAVQKGTWWGPHHFITLISTEQDPFGSFCYQLERLCQGGWFLQVFCARQLDVSGGALPVLKGSQTKAVLPGWEL